MNEGFLYMRIVKIILLLTFLAGLAVFLFKELRPKPFRFTDFDTIKKAQMFFSKNYPLNSNMEVLLKDLKIAGAVCHNVSLNKIEKTKYKTIMRCVYNSGWLSKQPLVDYIVLIYVSNDDKIKKLEFNKGYVGP